MDKDYPDVVAGAELLDVDELDDPDPALSPPDAFAGAEDFSGDFSDDFSDDFSGDDVSEPDPEPDDGPFLVVFADSRLSVR